MPSFKLVEYCTSKGIHCTAYSCLGSTDSPLVKDKTLVDIAQKKGKTMAQVMLKWGAQHGWSVIPKSVTPSRVESNFEVDGWVLDEGEMKRLDELPDRFKVCDDAWLPVRTFFGDGVDYGKKEDEKEGAIAKFGGV